MQPSVKLSYADYRSLPENAQYQLIDGELQVSPAPSLRHQQVVGEIFIALSMHVKTHALGAVFSAPVDLILSNETVVQPDVVFVSNGRRSFLASEGIRGAPDLCVEVLSPRTDFLDRQTKRKLYAQAGVLEYWIVDPDRNRIEVFELQKQPDKSAGVYTANQTLRSTILSDMQLPLSDVFET